MGTQVDTNDLGRARSILQNSTATFNTSHFMLLQIPGLAFFIEYYKKGGTTLRRSTYTQGMSCSLQVGRFNIQRITL